LRVTGGRLAGHKIPMPRAGGVRPSSDRVRESLFARLPALEGARVLDLYAGSGALGIEALSRGAVCATFVERSAACTDRLRATLAALGLAEVGRVVRGDAVGVMRSLARAGARFDLVLLDPPYGPSELARALRAVAAGGILAAGAVVVAESSRRHPPGDVEGLVRCDERCHGDTLIVRYTPRATGASDEQAARQAMGGTEAS
jgi:16S rRNA (guanine966-N2)-methyltransferase